MVEPGPDAGGLLVPPGARLLHAGMPKTGTTALQRTASARRELLLEHGVRYPGTGTNHRKALFAFSSRPVSWVGPGTDTPKADRWLRLRDEVRGEDARRVWLDNENLSDEPEETLAALLPELGGPAHVVVTMRSLPAQLASAWQQYLKSGVWISFETWLRRTVGETPDPATTPSFARRTALGDVVETWVRLVGRERVVVVVLDPDDRTLVARSFEQLLGLPAGALEEDALSGSHANRSMTAPEAELVRRVNRVVRSLDDISWRDYERFVRTGLVDTMLSRRTPGPDEQRIVPPTWAVDRAVVLAEQQIARIEASGVRVVGSLAHLAARVPSVDKARSPRAVPVDAATEALLAVLSTGLGRGPAFGPPPAPAPVKRARVEDVPSATLARMLVGRARRGVGRRVAWVARRRGDRLD